MCARWRIEGVPAFHALIWMSALQVTTTEEIVVAPSSDPDV